MMTIKNDGDEKKWIWYQLYVKTYISDNFIGDMWLMLLCDIQTAKTLHTELIVYIFLISCIATSLLCTSETLEVKRSVPVFSFRLHTAECFTSRQARTDIPPDITECW